jgi:signal transduction histidine kinase
MATIAISESQQSLIAGLESGRLLDHVPVPIVLLGASGTVWLNAAARELDDWLKTGDGSRSLIAELGQNPRATSIAGNDGSPATSVGISLRQQAGSERTYRATLIKSVGSGAMGCDAVVLARSASDPGGDDISAEIARVRLEEAQRQLLQADRMSTIGQLAAGVAHEINNPIGYVQSNIDTLREYTSNLFRLIAALDSALRVADLPDALLANVAKVRQEIDYDFLAKDLPTLIAESREGIDRVRKIIQDLRDFSRAGTTETWILADLHAGIDSTINIVWNELKYKAELVKDFGDLPQVECLPSQINQVLMNILVNAGHAIDKHGQIRIATRHEGDHVLIEISDNGKGIAAEHLPRIFEPFFTTKPLGKGTGLGLSISYGIVRKHNGQIDVRSEPGVGTTFIIWLPLRQQHPHQAGTEPTANAR